MKKKLIKLFIISFIIIFWSFMMGILIYNEYFYKKYFNINYKKIIKNNNKKEEKWSMTIYYGKNYYKIGKFNYSFYPYLDSTYDIETTCILNFSLKNFYLLKQIEELFSLKRNIENKKDKIFIKIYNKVHLGPDYKIKSIFFSINSDFIKIKGKGVIKLGKLILYIEHQGKNYKKEFFVPPEAMTYTTFEFPIKFKYLKVGDVFETTIFDPLSNKISKAIYKVKAKINKFLWYGKYKKAFILKSNFNGIKGTLWYDEFGNLLQYKIFSFTFIKNP